MRSGDRATLKAFPAAAVGNTIAHCWRYKLTVITNDRTALSDKEMRLSVRSIIVILGSLHTDIIM